MTSSIINYKVLAKIHPELGEECYVSKEVPKEVFIKHVYSLLSWLQIKNNIFVIGLVFLLLI